MPVNPNIPLSVQQPRYGEIASQGALQFLQLRQQQQAGERQNALIQLKQEESARKAKVETDKFKLREAATFFQRVDKEGDILGQIATERERVVAGSEESEFLDDLEEAYKTNPEKALQIGDQVVGQARQQKLIPEIPKRIEDVSIRLKEEQIKKTKVQTEKIGADIAEKEKKALTIREKEELKRESSLVKANVTIGKIDKALDQTGFFTTGLTGSVIGVIPGTSAHNLEKTIDTIKANIGFSELRQMRESSPTGGALGSIAVRELEFLQAALSSLDKSQSTEQLRENLKLVKTHYENWKQTIDTSSDTSSDTQKTTINIREGQTATHPGTKERMIYRNGQWQPL